MTPNIAMHPIAASLIRTMVPWLVGYVLAVAAKANLPIPETVATEVVVFFVTAAYYALARVLETRGRAAWGWLLGLPKSPTYDATAKVDEGSPTGEVAAPASDVAEEGHPVRSVAVDDDGSPQ